MDITHAELSTINKVAKNLSPFFAFGYYDVEDIEQEIRLICLQVLEGFDGSKKADGLYCYLFAHARNMLIDLRRLKLGRTISPCKSCVYDDGGKCTKHDDITECQRYRTKLDNNNKKKSVINPQPLDPEQVPVLYDLASLLDNAYIFAEIDKEIPNNLRRDYLRFLDGIRLPHYNRKQVLVAIREIAARKGFIKDGEIVDKEEKEEEEDSNG
jgi:DNA-directed RNA polymerase specialized sigma24 family protein